MFFRNLTVYRYPAAMDLSALESSLADCRLKPIGPLELQSRGFVSPFGDSTASFAHQVGNYSWIAVGGEQKLLPASAVNQLLHKRLAEIEAKDGRKLSGRARKRLREDLVHELLPRALVRPVRTDAIIDHALGIIAVDTASRKAADLVISELRRALGSFPALPLNAAIPPRAEMTSWIAGNAMPQGLALGDACLLSDPADKGASVKCTHQDLRGDEVAKHLEAGKQVARLALTLDDRLSFTVGEDLVVRQLKLLDGAVGDLESSERDDVRAELDARFVLIAGEVRRLWLVMESAFKVSGVS